MRIISHIDSPSDLADVERVVRSMQDQCAKNPDQKDMGVRLKGGQFYFVRRNKTGFSIWKEIKDATDH